mmetsp:Transcript_11545/g.28801  ORF Transcript_11545/g.28801 Transcript_11545/m.28801 type:complete len:275 (-) Transcript_11545:2158-2982(-)
MLSVPLPLLRPIRFAHTPQRRHLAPEVAHLNECFVEMWGTGMLHEHIDHCLEHPRRVLFHSNLGNLEHANQDVKADGHTNGVNEEEEDGEEKSARIGATVGAWNTVIGSKVGSGWSGIDTVESPESYLTAERKHKVKENNDGTPEGQDAATKPRVLIEASELKDTQYSSKNGGGTESSQDDQWHNDGIKDKPPAIRKPRRHTREVAKGKEDVATKKLSKHRSPYKGRRPVDLVGGYKGSSDLIECEGYFEVAEKGGVLDGPHHGLALGPGMLAH